MARKRLTVHSAFTVPLVGSVVGATAQQHASSAHWEKQLMVHRAYMRATSVRLGTMVAHGVTALNVKKGSFKT